MKKEYLTFVSNIKELPENQEIELTIRDLTPGPRKYRGLIVKAVLHSSPDRLFNGDILWVRSLVGKLYPESWAIKVIEEVGETMPGVPHKETMEKIDIRKFLAS